MMMGDKVGGPVRVVPRSPVCMNEMAKFCPIGGGDLGMGLWIGLSIQLQHWGGQCGAIAWFRETHQQSGIWRGGDHGTTKPHPSSPL